MSFDDIIANADIDDAAEATILAAEATVNEPSADEAARAYAAEIIKLGIEGVKQKLRETGGGAPSGPPVLLLEAAGEAGGIELKQDPDTWLVNDPGSVSEVVRKLRAIIERKRMEDHANAFSRRFWVDSNRLDELSQQGVDVMHPSPGVIDALPDLYHLLRDDAELHWFA